jgi:hypothetical protein
VFFKIWIQISKGGWIDHCLGLLKRGVKESPEKAGSVSFSRRGQTSLLYAQIRLQEVQWVKAGCWSGACHDILDVQLPAYRTNIVTRIIYYQGLPFGKSDVVLDAVVLAAGVVNCNKHLLCIFHELRSDYQFSMFFFRIFCNLLFKCCFWAYVFW